MKLKNLLCLAMLTFGLVNIPWTVHGATTGWEVVGPGIEYQEFRLPDPNNVFVARMERNTPTATLESTLAQGKINHNWKFETVSSMARRYDQAINYWGEAWGARNRVVVAINGAYYETATSYPDRGVFHSGWYAKQFTNKQNGSGFGWTLDRNPFIGECVNHPVGKQLIHFANGNPVAFNAINIARGANQLILYTPQFDSSTQTDNSGVEVLVEMSRPGLVLNAGESVTGIIREVRRNAGSTPIPFDHLVLSGQGLDSSMAGMKLWVNAEVGTEIRISHDIRSFAETDCSTPVGINWARTFAGVGGDYHFLKGGIVQSYLNNTGAIYRHPRTAIAYNNDYVFFIVVDGRNPGVSIGMTMSQLGNFAKEQLGATDGIALDGGGSSTMVVNGEVKNMPSDGIKQPSAINLDKSIYLPVISSTGGAAPPPPVKKVERGVVNGMLMVAVEPVDFSTAFTAGETLFATLQTEVRLGPGTNYGVLASIPQNAEGVVIGHPLAGVKAKGSYWWKMSIGGQIGWVNQSSLARR